VAYGLKPAEAKHAKDCSKPPGRFDLLQEVQQLEDAQRLMKPMTDTEMQEMEDRINGDKSESTTTSMDVKSGRRASST
jgi:hypothetical protein